MIKDTLLITACLTILGLALIASMDAGFVNRFDVYENQLCWEDGCVRFDNVYHEGQMPFKVEGMNPETKVLRIRVNTYFTNGSDGACQAFGALVNNVLEEMPEGWTVYVTNEFVPSARNPIDLEWSRVLRQ